MSSFEINATQPVEHLIHFPYPGTNQLLWILNCRLGNWKYPSMRWPHLCLSANTDGLRTSTTEIKSCQWSTNCGLFSSVVSAVPVQWTFTSTLEACRNNNIWQMMTWLWAKFNQTYASYCNKFFILTVFSLKLYSFRTKVKLLKCYCVMTK